MGITTYINEARGALGGELDRGARFAHPREEASAVHTEIARINHASKAATEELSKALGRVGDPHRERALQTLDFIDGARDLSYSEYRTVVGIINNCRDDRSGRSLEELLGDNTAQAHLFTPAVDAVIGSLRRIHDSAYAERNERAIAPAGMPFIDAELNAQVSDHAMLVLRSVHPLGVNVRNPGWAAAAGAASYRPDQSLELTLGDERRAEANPDVAPRFGAVMLKPKGDATVVKFVPEGKTWGDVSESVVLKPGESVIVGRPLVIPRELFGMSLDTKVELPVGVPLTGSSWSRGGLCICRTDDGAISILDRGMKHPLTCDRLVYTPRTIIHGGDITFGESRIG